MNILSSTVRSVIWTYVSYYGGRVMIFISTIILARLLTKEDFGIAGYAFVLINFLDLLNDLGVGQALIYHRDDPEASDTTFWLSITVGMGLFTISWLLAPLMGMFFHDPRAVHVTRVLALTFPLTALKNVPETLLRKGLTFGRKSLADTVRWLSKGVLSIVLALMGFGYWSLIYGQIGSMVVAVIAYWWIVPWRPSLRFSQPIARFLLSYGLSLVPAQILIGILNNVDYFLIGRFLGAEALGVYTVAFRIPELLIIQFCFIISQVVFPAYTKMNDSPEALQNGFLMTTRYVALVTVPVGLGLALVAGPFVILAFSERWAEAIPVMQAIAIYAMVFSFGFQAGSVYKAQGRPGMLTIQTAIQAVLLIPALWWSAVTLGTVTAVAWAHVAVTCVSVVLYLAVAARMIDITFKMMLNAFQPAFVAGTLMALVVAAVLLLVETTPALVQLAVAISSGGVVYVGALWLLHRDVVTSAGQTLRTALSRR